MNGSPLDAVPATVRRLQRVERVLAGLEDVDALPLEMQVERLAHAQEELAGVLAGTEIHQGQIPGLRS